MILPRWIEPIDNYEINEIQKSLPLFRDLFAYYEGNNLSRLWHYFEYMPIDQSEKLTGQYREYLDKSKTNTK
jgi:hypothetical protein